MSLTQYATAGERRAATRLVDTILAQGHSISVYDSEEWTVKRSTDRAAILDALATTDMDRIRVRDSGGNPLGSFDLIWGNDSDGTELIADHSDNEFCREIYERADACA